MKCKEFIVTVLVLLLCLPVIISSQKTGMKVAITSEGVNKVASSVIPFILDQVRNAKIPDVSGSTSVAVIGTVEYSVRNIAIQSFNMAGFTVGMNSGQQVSANVNGLSVYIIFNWSWRQKSWPHMGDSGGADASTQNSFVSATVFISIDETGHPFIKTVDTGCSLNNFNINIHGTWDAWLYNLFVSLFDGSIRSSVESAIKSAIQQAIDQTAEQALATLDLVQPVDSVSEIDFSFTSEVFTDTYMGFGGKGEFLWQKNPSDVAPFTPAPMPDVQDQHYVQIFLSDFVANSAGYTYWKAGQLQYLITPDIVPPQSPIKLNTTSFKFIIPALYKLYPNCAMQALFYTRDCPVSRFSSTEGISVQFPGALDVQVITPDSSIFDAFTIDVDIATAGQVFVNTKDGNPVVSGQLKYLNLTLKVEKSNIGDVNVAGLQVIIESLVSGVAIPYINNFLKNGFEIPNIEGVQFIDPTVSTQNGYVAIASNIIYTPSDKIRVVIN